MMPIKRSAATVNITVITAVPELTTATKKKIMRLIRTPVWCPINNPIIETAHCLQEDPESGRCGT